MRGQGQGVCREADLSAVFRIVSWPGLARPSTTLSPPTPQGAAAPGHDASTTSVPPSRLPPSPNPAENDIMPLPVAG
jgi:hypothetical protein